MRLSWRSLVAVGLLIGLVAVVAGCGSSSSSSSTTDTKETSETKTTGTEEGGSGPQQEAKKFVSEHSNLQDLKWPEPPDEPYDPGTGKIGIVSTGNAGSGSVEMGKEAVKAAKAAGWEPTEPLDGEFTPSVQSGLIQQLVTEKVDGIVLISIQPETVAAAVNAATEAGIPVSDVYSADGEGIKTLGVTMVGQSGIETGEFIGTYIGANSEGKTRVDVVGNDPGFPILVERTKGVEAGLEKYCPECELHVTPLSASELAKPGPPAFSALLSSNPPGTLEWVVGGPADPFGELMMKTAEQQGRSEIEMIGSDVSAAPLENLSEGGITKADILAGYRYGAWAGVEQVIRRAAGLKPWKADNIPSAFVTSENVEEVLSQAPQYYQPPSFDYEKLFAELWSGK